MSRPTALISDEEHAHYIDLKGQGFDEAWATYLAMFAEDERTLTLNRPGALSVELTLSPFRMPKHDAVIPTHSDAGAQKTLNALYTRLRTDFPEWCLPETATPGQIRDTVHARTTRLISQEREARRTATPAQEKSIQDLVDMGLTLAWARLVYSFAIDGRTLTGPLPPFSLNPKIPQDPILRDHLLSHLNDKGFEFEDDMPHATLLSSVSAAFDELEVVHPTTRAFLDAAAKGGLNGLKKDLQPMRDWTNEGWKNTTLGEDLPAGWRRTDGAHLNAPAYKNTSRPDVVCRAFRTTSGWGYTIDLGPSETSKVNIRSSVGYPTRHDAMLSADKFLSRIRPELPAVESFDPEGHAEYGPRIRVPGDGTVLLAEDEEVLARYLGGALLLELAEDVYWRPRHKASCLWVARKISDYPTPEAYWRGLDGVELTPYVDPVSPAEGASR